MRKGLVTTPRSAKLFSGLYPIPKELVLTYKGYKGEYAFYETEGKFQGKLSDIKDVVIFQGKSLASLEQEFEKAVDLYIEWRKKYGPSS